MNRLRGLYILDPQIFPLVYEPEVRRAIDAHVEMLAPCQSGASVAENPGLLAEAEVIFSGWGGPVFDERFFELAPHVRAVFHAGGCPRLPHQAASRGVVMTSAEVANSIPVAEYTLAMILLSLKHSWHLIHQTRAQQTFPDRNGAPGGYEKCVGIIGLGTIARLLLSLLYPLDLHLLARDPYISDAKAAELNVELVSLDDIFRRSDVVSLHAAHLPETVGMITGKHLASMPQGATFINTARGALVRENELIDVARSRPDLQFVLDVTHPEPPVAGSPLYTLPNVVLTPHIAGSAGGECRRMGDFLVEELERFVTGQPLKWATANSIGPAPRLSPSSMNRASVSRPRISIARKIRNSATGVCGQSVPTS